MSSHTTTGMQQKEGTNYDGPKPVDPAPISSAYASRSFANLAQKIEPNSSAGAWAAPVKKVVTPAPAATSSKPVEAVPEPQEATALTTLPGATNLSLVILDSGAFISSGSVALHATSAGFELLSRLYRENDGKVRFVTTQAVLNELKDEKTRQMLASLPFEIEVQSVSADAIRECYRFATLTGDAKTLSATDIQIIALTYQFEKQYNGSRFIKKEPTKGKAMDAINAATGNKPADTTSSTSTPVADAAPATDSAPLSSPPDASTTSTNAPQHEECEDDDGDEAPVEPAPAAAAPAASSSAPAASSSPALPGFDQGDDGEGAWITPSNIHQQARPVPKPTEPESTIAVITTDYAMQNVLLQMGLRLLNLKGRSIRSIRSWMKKCHACNTLSNEMEREFCSACGGHTMIRVNVTVNKAGLVRYWHGTRHLNLRGTIYSIPMPRAGRHANNLKFSEDVIDDRIRKGGALMGNRSSDSKGRGFDKTPQQLFQDSIEFGLGRSGPQTNDKVYGYGRKNVNAMKGNPNKNKKKK